MIPWQITLKPLCPKLCHPKPKLTWGIPKRKAPLLKGKSERILPPTIEESDCDYLFSEFLIPRHCAKESFHQAFVEGSHMGLMLLTRPKDLNQWISESVCVVRVGRPSSAEKNIWQPKMRRDSLDWWGRIWENYFLLRRDLFTLRVGIICGGQIFLHCRGQ